MRQSANGSEYLHFYLFLEEGPKGPFHKIDEIYRSISLTSNISNEMDEHK